MRNILILIISAILGIWVVAPGKVSGSAFGASDFPPQHWCGIKLKGLFIDSDTFFTTIMPRRSLDIEIVPRSPVTDVRWLASGGRVSSDGVLAKTFTAPSKAGFYPLEIRARMDDKPVRAKIQIFVLVPATEARNGWLEGYHIGEYPDPSKRKSPIYRPPEGYIRVTKDILKEPVSDNYFIKDFLCPGPDRYPQFLVLDELLIYKLEKVTHEFQRLGLLSGRMSFLSAYRTPAYNVKPGQARYSRHQWGAALDIFIDERGRPGWMDDLTRDGEADVRDAILMYKVIDSMYARGELKGFDGGIGIYPETREHGPFVHIDIRERPARWANDSNGRKVKDIDEWLALPQNKVILPAGVPESPARVAYSAPSNINSTASLKNRISALEKTVLGMEEQAAKNDVGRGPLTPNDTYIAIDIINGSLLLNRGRMILKRVKVNPGQSAPSCPVGLAGIYQLPRGILEVRRNKLEPIWFHPPWALIGNDIPGSYSQYRSAFFSGINLQAGIDLGGGTKLYGLDGKIKTVLPGCLGMAPEDLKAVSSRTEVGMRVYMFEAGASPQEDSAKKQELIMLYDFLRLREQAADLSSRYVVLDMDKRRGFLKQGDKVVRNFAFDRVGPNFSKSFPNAEREFRMPKGVFIVRCRYTDPPWYKPNWMYEEQRRKVPDALAPSRVQTELLGKYGIYLGAGMVIHGVHDPRVPDSAIDYIAIELKENDLYQVWKSLPADGLVIIR